MSIAAGVWNASDRFACDIAWYAFLNIFLLSWAYMMQLVINFSVVSGP